MTSIAERLAGRRVAVTGITGFVGQALLTRLLEDVPAVRPVLLVRGSAEAGARDRVVSLLREAPAFDRVRTAGRLEEVLERLEVVDADLDRATLDLPPHDVLVHVAGNVSFDDRIDVAFRTHATGVERLYRAARDAGCEHVVHVSTAYVAARRAGPVPEDPVRGDLDWRTEAAAADDLAARAEVVSRQPARLQRFLAEARRAVGTSGAQAVADDAERRRLDWVRDQLVDAGRQRARTLGFTDAYTLTKACGEVVAEECFADRRLSIVRPTIIESALRRPTPGWIEGFKVADPLIVGFGRGDIPDFPGIPDGVVDIVPVDFVANALLAAAAHPPPQGEPVRLTVGTGARNPLSLHRMYRIVRDSYDADPLPGRDGLGARLPIWRFPGPDRLERQLAVAATVTRVASRAVQRSPITGERIRGWGRSLDRTQRRFATLERFLELFGPYALVEAVYLDDATQRLREQLSPQDRATFGFDPQDVDWDHYLGAVHVPAISAPLRAVPRSPRASPPPPALHDGSPRQVLAVFDLDGTVASANVITTYLRARMADDRLAGAREAADLLRTLPRYLALDATGREHFLRVFYRRFEGADVAALDRLVVEELGDRVLADLSPAAVRRIREHRDRGHRTVLITGALRSFCEPLRSLFDTITAAELEVDAAGRATGNLAAPPLVGSARAAWLRRYAQQVGADLTTSYAYADSRSDIPLLEAVGHPVAVDPDVVLHGLARRRHWPVAAWKDGDRHPARAG